MEEERDAHPCRRKAVLGVVAACAVLWAMCAPAAWCEADAIRVTLRHAGDAQGLVGEPVVLDVALETDAEGPRTVRLPPQVGQAPLMIEVCGPGEAEWRVYQPPSTLSLMAPLRAPLAADGAIRLRGILATMETDDGAGANRFVLALPGAYRFRARFTVESGDGDKPASGWPTVVSNEVQVTVAAPADRDAEALALWRAALQRAAFDLGSLDPSDEAVAALIAGHPDTVYGRHVRHALAKRGALPESTLQGRSQEACRQAILEDLYLNAPDFALRDEVMMALAEAYRSAQRFSDGAGVLGELLAEYPDSPLAEEAAERKPWYERYAEDAERAAADGE